MKDEEWQKFIKQWNYIVKPNREEIEWFLEWREQEKVDAKFARRCHKIVKKELHAVKTMPQVSR